MSTLDAPQTHRARGGQPGNLNALKHGFYARGFPRSDLHDLESATFKGLAEEIALLRLYLRRVIQDSKDSHDLPTTLLTLRTLCLASSCLNRLLRTQYLLVGKDDPIHDALERALDEVTRDLGLDRLNDPGLPETEEPN